MYFFQHLVTSAQVQKSFTPSSLQYVYPPLATRPTLKCVFQKRHVTLIPVHLNVIMRQLRYKTLIVSTYFSGEWFVAIWNETPLLFLSLGLTITGLMLVLCIGTASSAQAWINSRHELVCRFANQCPWHQNNVAVLEQQVRRCNWN